MSLPHKPDPVATSVAVRPARNALWRSAQHMAHAETVLARGVASSARLRPTPLAFSHADGARLCDVDGNEYLDLVLALGPLLLGHNPREVIDAVGARLEQGILFGGQHSGELELARRIVRLVPCAETVLLSTTGSEAVQAAIRVARARTGRRLILKFEGHYHGWIDPVFVNGPGIPPASESGVVPTVPNTAGAAVPEDVLVCPWNDLEALAAAFDARPDEIAAVIMEPIPCNFGTFLPDPGYLAATKALCRERGALLIFDEVVSGFRLALGGAQELLGVVPDIAVYAKALASGFALSLVAGSRDALAPAIGGPVHHAGTYNGSCAPIAAANATLWMLERSSPMIYRQLDDLGTALAAGLRERAHKHGIPLGVQQVGSVVQLLWGVDEPVRSYEAASISSASWLVELSELVLRRGLHTAPRGLLLLSAAHTRDDIATALDAYDSAFQDLAPTL